MAMDAQALIIFLIIGAVAGWLAGQIMKIRDAGVLARDHAHRILEKTVRERGHVFAFHCMRG